MTMQWQCFSNPLQPNGFFEGLLGWRYFAESRGDDYDYFKDEASAVAWAKKHRPAKVYKIPRFDSQFYGEKGKSPAVDGSGRDVGNATLVKVVR